MCTLSAHTHIYVFMRSSRNFRLRKSGSMIILIITLEFRKIFAKYLKESLLLPAWFQAKIVKLLLVDEPGCNIGFKTLLAERGKLPLKFTYPAYTSTCPTTMLNKGELNCRELFRLPDCYFLLNSLATCSGASGYVARCEHSRCVHDSPYHWQKTVASWFCLNLSPPDQRGFAEQSNGFSSVVPSGD